MNLSAAGKSALLAAGAGLGLMHALRAAGNAGHVQKFEAMAARIDRLYIAVSRLADQTEKIETCLEQRPTRRDLNEVVNGVLDRLECGIRDGLAVQARSVESLRLMVNQTDDLLKRVLAGLEESCSDESEIRLSALGHQ